MGVWPLRDPHSRGDIQTRTSRRDARGEGAGVAGPGGRGGSVPRNGPGRRTTACLGLSPAQTPGSKKQSRTPGPRGPDSMTQKPGWMWRGPVGLAWCPPITREAGRAPELGRGDGGGAAVTLSSPESFPGQGRGGTDQGRCPRLRERKGGPGPTRSRERGKEAEAGPRGSSPTWPASQGSCQPLGAPPAGSVLPSGDLRWRCAALPGGPAHAPGAPFLSAPSPALPSARGCSTEPLCSAWSLLSVHHCALGTKRPESPLTTRPCPALPFQKR